MKKDYHLLPAERETIITFNDADKTANIYSTSQTWINKIKKFDGWRENGPGVEVDVPKKWIRVQRPNVCSEEAREKRREAMKKYNLRRKKTFANEE